MIKFTSERCLDIDIANGCGMEDYERYLDHELGINNCGIQKISDRDYHTVRTRIDYSVMYISEGKATININGNESSVNAGELMLYLPNAKQDFKIYAKDLTVNKWLHFSGRLAKRLDGAPARIIKINSRYEFESNIDRLVKAYYRIDPEKDMLCDGYLRTLLALIIESEKMQDISSNNIQNRLHAVLNYIHIHTNEKIDLDYCAELCYLSRDRFNHVFKDFTGLSPNNYQIKLKIDRAKQYLCDQGMSVGECAETLGFNDVNYFCRLFKKETGYTPSEFKKM